jgi:PAS domain-containing protein
VGKEREELEGSVFMPVTSNRYSDVIATQMTKLFRPPFACTVEQWIQTTRGMRCFSWSARSVLDEAKSVVAIVATGRGITKIRHELIAIRKKDDDLMLILESGGPMYYSHDPEQRMLFVSPRIRALLGSKPPAGDWM